MATRTVIEIDEELCDGCGLCVTGCHEGALRVIDGKARMIGDSLCDGLGACIGECPRDAITKVEREAEAYDERRVIEHLLPKGIPTIAAHLGHLRDHGQAAWLSEGIEVLAEHGVVVPGFGSVAATSAPHDHHGHPVSGGCPGSAARSFGPTPVGQSAVHRAAAAPAGERSPGRPSALGQWPVQLHLVNPRAPYFHGADLLVAADCTAFACGAFHSALLAGRRLVIACPKLDSGPEIYVEKLRALVEEAEVASITVAIMEVPCCGGLQRIVDAAVEGSAREVPVSTVVVGIENGSLTWV